MKHTAVFSDGTSSAVSSFRWRDVVRSETSRALPRLDACVVPGVTTLCASILGGAQSLGRSEPHYSATHGVTTRALRMAELVVCMGSLHDLNRSNASAATELDAELQASSMLGARGGLERAEYPQHLAPFSVKSQSVVNPLPARWVIRSRLDRHQARQESSVTDEGQVVSRSRAAWPERYARCLGPYAATVFVRR